MITFPVIILPLVAFFFTLITLPLYAKEVTKYGHVVRDVNKKIETFIPRPVSLPMLIGFIIGQSLIFFVFQNFAINMVIAVAIISFGVGWIDDTKVQKGWFKPVLLLSTTVPIILLGTFHNSLVFPILGLVRLDWYLYMPLMAIMIPVIANTVNSIDVVNGVVTAVMTVASIALALILMINGDMELSLITMVLTCISFAAFYYHRFPSKLFIGDSGTLMMGAIFMAIAIAGNVEVFAVIILAPLILNSFLYLASVRKFAEHREIKNPPIIHDENMRLCDSKLDGAPWTLVRLLVKEEPQTEKQLFNVIVVMTVLTSIIAVGLAMLT